MVPNAFAKLGITAFSKKDGVQIYCAATFLISFNIRGKANSSVNPISYVKMNFLISSDSSCPPAISITETHQLE